jgi:hypothetical protein
MTSRDGSRREYQDLGPTRKAPGLIESVFRAGDGGSPLNDPISIRGARVHNLQGVDCDIPRNSLVVITGPSGSGKSSLAFDTLYAEGQRRYVESLSAYARQFLDQMEKPDVESVSGLSPAIAIEQRTTVSHPRSTVGTVTEIYDHLRVLFAALGQPHCPRCERPITSQTVEQIAERLWQTTPGTSLSVLAPVVRRSSPGWPPRASPGRAWTGASWPSIPCRRSIRGATTAWTCSSTAWPCVRAWRSGCWAVSSARSPSPAASSWW